MARFELRVAELGQHRLVLSLAYTQRITYTLASGVVLIPWGRPVHSWMSMGPPFPGAACLHRGFFHTNGPSTSGRASGSTTMLYCSGGNASAVR